MNYERMSKKELIDFIRNLKKQRAFNYEDRMKLAILDKSPFTIWASNRNCEITLWSGQCEALYGYSRSDAEGKDYVKLFVAPDEQVAARRDQLSIIDEGAVFHNIANDIGKNGNTLQLITNCFRVQDPCTGEYWNAEMGLIIDYLEQEKERLNQIISESKQIKECISNFIDTNRSVKEQFISRRQNLYNAIRECERKAIAKGMREKYRESKKEIERAMDDVANGLEEIIDIYYARIQSCSTYGECVDVFDKFRQKCVAIFDRLEEIMLDFEEIDQEYNEGNTSIRFKDLIMQETFNKSTRLNGIANEFLTQIDKDISEFRSLGKIDSASPRLVRFGEMKKSIEMLKERITSCTNYVLETLVIAKNENSLLNIRQEMEEKFKELEQELQDAKGG